MNAERPAIDDGSWKRLRYRGAPLKERVLADLPDSAPPLLRQRLWQSFKKHCAAEGSPIPALISQLEPQSVPPGMFQRRGPRKAKESGSFGDLPLIQRLQAEDRFSRLCERWAGNLPSWRRAILAGVARRLTLHPPDSDWGKRMRRIKGGVHCQRVYRERGSHPLVEFNQAMAKRQKTNLEAKEKGKQEPVRPLTPAQEARNRLGITPEQMQGVPRISSILKSVEGSFESVVEGLRWSREEDARQFLQKCDSIPPADLEHLSFEEICVAAGVDPRRLLRLAVDEMLWFSLITVKMQLANNLPKVTQLLIAGALTEKGNRERRLFFEISGFLPYTPRRNAAAPILEGRPVRTRAAGRSCSAPSSVTKT
jgi:hypothetical protein